jgi:penicillin-insensitive murein endopeptidase
MGETDGGKMSLRNLLIAALFGLATVPANAAPLAKDLFGAMTEGSDRDPRSIGSYARGCGDGFEQLPETGPTWQAMRLSRNRNWGHPELVDFLQDLSIRATEIGWPGLYIGDMSQPRGGPMTSGHSSHQIGLDADIWLLKPKRLDLSRGEREEIGSPSVRTEDQRNVTAGWTAAHAALLKAAALDPRVDRIFITPPAKIAMCKTATAADKKWLQKIRPLYGHDSHFHVRLKCPRDSTGCETQKPSVNELSNGGDGCDETLNWWVTDYLEELKNPPKKPREPREKTPREFTMADLPRTCAAVLQ